MANRKALTTVATFPAGVTVVRNHRGDYAAYLNAADYRGLLCPYVNDLAAVVNHAGTVSNDFVARGR